ncbi:MAG: preprotein translocase subunit SecE [bacterium]|jgi:preprotein translocase subunit SecE
MGTSTTTNRVANWGGRIVKFFREVRKELSKVHWPNRSEVMSYTVIVLVAVLIVSTLIWLVDSAITQLLKLILLR